MLLGFVLDWMHCSSNILFRHWFLALCLSASPDRAFGLVARWFYVFWLWWSPSELQGGEAVEVRGERLRGGGNKTFVSTEGNSR